MIEFDVGVACVISLVLVQIGLTTIFLSVGNTSEMLEYAREQRARIIFSDRLLNEYAVYDEDCHSIVPQTIGSVPIEAGFNVSLRKIGEKSEAEGIVIKRLVFVGGVKKENERILEVW